MKIKLLKIILITAILLSMTVPVSAEVFTTEKTEGMANCVYVAGNPDAYPVEYYDEKTEKYQGIIPDILEKVSQDTGVDFVYINGNKSPKDVLGKNLQAEIISAYRAGEHQVFVADYVEVFSYDKDGKTERIGFAFTEISDKEMIAKIKESVESLGDNQINGIVLQYTQKKAENSWLVWVELLGILLIGAVVVLLVVRMKRIKQQNKIDKLTDEETGIGNLAYFKHRFENTIDAVSRNLYYVAYIILDSSYLRTYHGSTTFSEVLGYTVEILEDNRQDAEIVARITENGFAFAYHSVNEEDAKKRITEVIDKLNRFVDNKERNEKYVFHAAVYNLNVRDKNSEILLFNLRKNCNRIFGTEQQVIFCDEHTMNSVQEEKKITESIIRGLERNEFRIYLQFIVDNKSKQIVSAEALSRWDSPKQGLLAPGKYIEAMEAAGLISRHDFYMFDQVCRQLQEWQGTDMEHISISCNFTRITISESNFVDRLEEIAGRYTFNRGNLVIEITEDAIEKNVENAMNNVAKCKELGFRIALDDMGSGYTSLLNLCDYPIDVVKIDREILLKADSEKGRRLFGGVIALAHSLNLKVVCEGVETPEQNERVTASECDYVQGWYYAKALPTEECEGFVKEYNKRL